MVGGRARARSPRELTENPEAWPHAASGDAGAEAVRQIARNLEAALRQMDVSLRGAAAGSGVNRQTIADLLAGRSWPDVATVARLIRFTQIRLWPSDGPIDERELGH
ncbi:helix-turn-helix domain-containing protein [Streptomyces daliensis]|uniref:Helix-turn-helix transcriptional regulator n=1 Tax=Streptomyces daliensis TaxID=299421 RepID=A0A8T4J0G1_9ACTN|nr:helix-turn-helix transcriptional regulator [Streptomyces daliensis]